MNRAAIGIGLVTITTGWIIVISFMIFSSLPYNSLHRQVYSKRAELYGRFFPEGFSFFTRSPREPQIALYSMDYEVIIKPNNSVDYLLGFDRSGRALSIELGIIWNVVHDQKWFDCYPFTPECFTTTLLPVYEVENKFSPPMLCGEYYLTPSEPIPWAWAASFKEKNGTMPTKIMRLMIACHETH
jgi:antimicrobial peptide system SdpA family protein